jgi:hypothetical protein
MLDEDTQDEMEKDSALEAALGQLSDLPESTTAAATLRDKVDGLYDLLGVAIARRLDRSRSMARSSTHLTDEEQGQGAATTDPGETADSGADGTSGD